MTEFLRVIESQLPSLKPLVQEIESDHQKKLWHNLTDKVERMLESDELSQSTTPPELLTGIYSDFLAKFDARINALRLALIVVRITEKLQGRLALDELQSFVESALRRVDGTEKHGDNREGALDRYRANMKHDQREAEIVLEVERANCIMQRPSNAGIIDAKKALRAIRDKMDHFTQTVVDSTVQAHYYRVMAELLKRNEELNDFYRNALLYLAYTPLESIPLQKQRAMAFDIGLAALAGDRIYNFGELLGHPVVETLQGTDAADWLYRLLFAFNRGNIQDYERTMQQVGATEIASRPLLAQRTQFLQEKIQIMCIMELVFQRSADNRDLAFDEIARATGRSLDDVEYLLLRALSLGLIRGSIDQVNQSIHVTWVQPRVLDRTQVSSLSRKIGAWLDKLDRTMADLTATTTSAAELPHDMMD